MASIFSFSGAFLLLFLSGITIISLICGTIVIAFTGLNERLKSLGR
jgi:hypothetical protein